MTTIQPAVSEFLARMRAVLDDLPPTEVTELFEDVETHVEEIAAEVGAENLATRLGTPEAYAAELRAAAGYPAAGPKQVPVKTDSSAVLAVVGLGLSTVCAFLVGMSGLRGLSSLVPAVLLGMLGIAMALPVFVQGKEGMRSVAELPVVRAIKASLEPDVSTLSGQVMAYVISLQPAWWLIRVILPVLALAVYRVTRYGMPATLLMMIPFAVASVLVGKRSKVDRRLLWVVVPANAFVLSLLFGSLNY